MCHKTFGNGLHACNGPTTNWEKVFVISTYSNDCLTRTVVMRPSTKGAITLLTIT